MTVTEKTQPEVQRPIAFVNARLIDPEAGETRGGVLIEGNRLDALGAAVTAANLPSEAAIIDCRGDCVAPGLIDLWAGLDEGEGLEADCRAAAAGGITTVVVRPGVSRFFDKAEGLESFQAEAGLARIRLLLLGALSLAAGGAQLADLAALQKAGAAAFSEGSKSLVDEALMRQGMEEARTLDAVLLHYCEDPGLAASGVMNDGTVSRHLGLPGISPEAETKMLERDLRLVASTGTRYHAPLISTSASVEMIRKAKAAGLPVTCGTSINLLSFNEIDIGDKNPAYKFAPPLRGEDERQALIAAVAEGTIDVISSDHTPLVPEQKAQPFETAACGAVGFELLLSAGLRLVTSGAMDLPRLIKAFALRPAQILGLPQGRLKIGAPADLIQFDPEEPYVVEASSLLSRAKNTPFDKARMEGRIKRTIVAGKPVFEAG